MRRNKRLNDVQRCFWVILNYDQWCSMVLNYVQQCSALEERSAGRGTAAGDRPGLRIWRRPCRCQESNKINMFLPKNKKFLSRRCLQKLQSVEWGTKLIFQKIFKAVKGFFQNPAVADKLDVFRQKETDWYRQRGAPPPAAHRDNRDLPNETQFCRNGTFA